MVSKPSPSANLAKSLRTGAGHFGVNSTESLKVKRPTVY